MRSVGDTGVDHFSGWNIRGYTTPIAYALYDSLTKYGPNFEALPDLAEAWAISPDGKAITWKLRKDVKFHEGTDFNAQAVKFNVDYMIQGHPELITQARPVLKEAISKVTVDDDYTITFHLTRPFRPLISYMGGQETMLMSPTAVQKVGKGVEKSPVGAGPFKLKSWIVKGDVEIEKFDNYWDKGRPYLDGIKYRYSVDASVIFAIVRTGEADFAVIPASDVPLALKNPNLKVVRHEGGRFEGLYMNPNKKLYNSKALRQAIAYGIDRQRFIDVILSGAGRPAYAPIGIGWAAYPSDVQTYKYDPQKAKQKLTEAGYPREVTVQLDFPSTEGNRLRGETFQAMLQEVGISVKLAPQEPTGFHVPGNLISQLYPFAITTRGPQADPHNLLSILFRTGGAANYTHYSNPEVDRLIDEAATVYDVARAKELYKKVMDIVIDDAPYVYLAYKDEFAVMHKKVQGFVWIPDADLRLQDIWMEQ